MNTKRLFRIAGVLSGATIVLLSMTGALASASHPKGIKVYFIGGTATDPFWSIVRHGAEAAGKAVASAGGSVTWLAPKNYDSLGLDAAALVKTAVFAGAQAIVVPDWVPAAEDAAIKDAVKAKIPVVIVNSGGIQEAKATGALTYVGTDESLAGTEAGKYFGAHHSKLVLCVNTGPGNTNYEARCAGVQSGIRSAGGKMTTLWLNMSNFGNSSVASAVKVRLQKMPSIDGVITMGADDADSAAAAIKDLGKTGKIKLGSFDLTNISVVNRIDAGTQLFAVDQQPYLQGYLATSIVWQYAQFGIKRPDGPQLTGPAIVDKSNVHLAKFGSSVGAR